MYGNMHYQGIKQSLDGIGVKLRRIDGGKFFVKVRGTRDDEGYETDCLHDAYTAGIIMQKGH